MRMLGIDKSLWKGLPVFQLLSDYCNVRGAVLKKVINLKIYVEHPWKYTLIF